LRWIGLLVGAVLLGVAALAWRLASGPISLDLVTPRLASALSAPDGSLAVAIGATELAWDRRDDDLDLRLRDVRLTGADGETRASFTALSLRLNLLALLWGKVVPTEIDLDDPTLRLVVRPDGRIDLGTGAVVPAEAAPPGREVAAGEGAVGVPPWIESLRRVRIRRGELALVAPNDAAPFDLRGLDVTLERFAGRVTLRYRGALERGELAISLSGEGQYDVDRAAGSVALAFANLAPGVVAELIAEVSGTAKQSEPGLGVFLEALRMPLSGEVRLALADEKPVRVELDLSASSGSFAVHSFPPIEMTQLRLAAIADLTLGQVGLLDLRMDLGGPSLQVVGTVADLAGEGAFAGTATVASLPVASLPRYWPDDAAPDARSWIVERIREGRVRTAKVRLAGRLVDPATGELAIDPPAGWVAFERLAVRFLDAMPPARTLSGHGRFSAAGWDLAVLRGGAVGGVEIRHADVRIATPETGAPRIAIEAHVRGGLAETVSLLERKPVRLADALGFRPAVTGGSVWGRFGLDLALGGPAAARRPAVSAIARATDVSLKHVFRGADFAGGDLRLRLAKGSLGLRATGDLAGAPVEIAWQESLGSGAARRRVDVDGRLDAAARAALGFDARPVLDGTVAVQLSWEEPPGGDARVDLALGLDDASLDATPIAVKKPIGAAGNASARLVVRKGGLAAIEKLSIETPSARVSGGATLAPGGTVVRSLDLVTTFAATTGAAPVRLTTTVRPGPRESALSLRCDDASVWLEAVRSESDWTGGRLELTGSGHVALDAFRFDGHLDVRDVVLQRSELFTSIISLTSLSGIRNALTGKSGLRFDQVATDLVVNAEQVRLRDGAASGPALRILADGTIDRTTEAIALEGTLVPSYYGLNEAPKNIPVLGNLLGGTANAVLTVEFEVTGPLSDPKVSVSPLASVAPGFLRDLLKRLD
jgi:hypothetical protein